MDVKDKIISFSSLYKAATICARNVRWKDSVSSYYNHSLIHTYKLRQSLLKGEYKISPYSKFFVYEPKKREITSTKFKDRVFQRSLCDNYLYQELTKGFIKTNCACQIGKGTDYARDILKNMLKECNNTNWWCLKCDLKDFFGSTSHVLAKSAIINRVGDEYVRNCVYDIIDSFDGDKGIGLGSQVSQIIQLAVLDDMDKLITKDLNIVFYVRYMDDFILFHKSRNYLQYARKKINEYLVKNGLRLSPKKTQLFRLYKPIHFLGFSFQLHGNGKITKKLLKHNTKDERRRLKKMYKTINEEHFKECYQSWRAFASKSNSRGRIMKMDRFYKSLTFRKE